MVFRIGFVKETLNSCLTAEREIQPIIGREPQVDTMVLFHNIYTQAFRLHRNRTQVTIFTLKLLGLTAKDTKWRVVTIFTPKLLG